MQAYAQTAGQGEMNQLIGGPSHAVGPLPSIKLTPQLLEKTALSTVLGVASMYFLAAGRREKRLDYFIYSVITAFLSIFLF